MRIKEINRRLEEACERAENLAEFDEQCSELALQEIARDLNQIRARTEYIASSYASNSGDESDVYFCEAALRIISRVAEIEEVPTKTKTNTAP